MIYTNINLPIYYLKKSNSTKLNLLYSYLFWRSIRQLCEPNIADNEYLNIDNILIYTVIDVTSK